MRRLAVEGPISFNTLKRFCIDMFDELEEDQFEITYIDDENDTISIGSNVELEEAFRISEKLKETSISFSLQKKDKEKTVKKTITYSPESKSVIHTNKSSDLDFEKAVADLEPEENVQEEESNVMNIEDPINMDIDLKTLESIEESLRKVSEQVNSFQEAPDFGSKFKDIIEALSNKIKMITSTIDEKIFIPLSKAARNTIEEFQRDLRKLKEDILNYKNQIADVKPKSTPKQMENIKKDALKKQEEDNCSVVMNDLAHLEEMGFMNRKLNLEILAKHPNNLNAAVMELLSRTS